MREIVKRILLAAALVAMLAPSALAGGKLLLGVAGAHSGDLASYGLPTVNAAKLVADKINAAGGVNGMTVEVVAEDDQCKPELATNAATKLLSDGVKIVLGHICSGATKAALPIYLDGEMVVMSPSATNPPLTQSGEYPNFFRTISSDDAQASLDVAYAKTLGLKKLAVIHDKGDYGKGFATFAKQFLDADPSMDVVLFEGVTPGAVDYSAVVQKIKSAGADGVVFGGYHPEASKIVMAMRKKGLDIPFISDDGVKDDTFIKVAGQYAEGVYASGPKDFSKNPLFIEAVAAHKAKFGTDPGAFFPEAYSAALALLNAVKVAGGTDYAKVCEALRTSFVDTPVGKIKFDAKGDAEGVGFSIYQVKGGKYVQVQ
ncbi:branched-chain amino acid ABC transporter substrate-binding protein [Pseudodesulfovibrio sp.]|uniref:branched-chain amino acid ABC transporter substrate-binding protein n=1 Tax=Pseudodesulfovibrio sp. TaxID=2035812 RepID=UPI00260FCE36|nr:branched-chain amino acid ABC transporter substrate-binding protein [Pseudodesulfovibrio sp.]MDD3311970.1 branched-chain amino acid ABC transporter substrate-binding protein [Pseudodesulfovibrio sp.]